MAAPAPPVPHATEQHTEAAPPIARPFSWYVLVHDDKAGYRTLPAGTCTDLVEFCQYLNHMPAPGDAFDGKHALKISGGEFWGYGLCFFDAGVRPEWEDAGNQDGVDLVCRQAFAPAALTEAWRALLLLMINGQLDMATGVRCVMKAVRGGVVHKLEVWTRTAEWQGVAETLRHHLRLEFACVPRRLAKK